MKTALHHQGRGFAMAVTLAIAITTAACSGDPGRGGAEENPPGNVSGGAGSAPNGATATPTTAAAAKPGATSASASATAQSAAVSRLLQRAHSADRATYTVSYRAILAGGAKATVRLAQQPPRFRFEQVKGTQRSLAIFDGRLLHGCLATAAGWRCTQAITLDDPTVVGNAYPPAVLLFIDNLTPLVNRSLRATITTRTVMGHRVDCATYVPVMRNPPPPSVYCVRPDGVLAYSRTSDGQILELTAFRAAVSAGDLTPPK
jgi:hypothetical protein